jgi:hypothetical protein
VRDHIHMPRAVISTALLYLATIVPFATLAGAAEQSSTSEAQCRALADTDLTDTVILSAVQIDGAGAVSTYCRVRGYVRPAINFELQLPVKEWNGKFYMAGCGGYCGRLDITSDPNAAFNVGRDHHYATILTDTGHWAPNALDNRWAVANPVALNDFFFRSIAEIGRVGKALTRDYYNKPIRYSYFNGCSNGGRQGVIAATVFPDEFDGILSGAPDVDLTPLFALAAWTVDADSDAQGRPVLDPKKLSLLRAAVAKACGDEKGLVTDPDACRFDPRGLQCPAGKQSASCLTEAEVTAIRKIYAPPTLKTGEKLLSAGQAYGSELFWAFPDQNKLFTFQRQASGGMRRFDVIAGPQDDDVDLDRDYSAIDKHFHYLQASTDLSKFHEHNGKLILYQGAADTVVPSAMVQAYYETVQHNLGARTAADTLRLFMVPGLGHCRNAPELDSPGFNAGEFDALSALEAWVEQGKQPDQIIATKHDAQGKALRSLPLCPFPATARYLGSGDRAAASSYKCVNSIPNAH